MSKNYKQAVRNLETWLADDSQMSLDDLRKELAAEGVDVNAFLGRFGAVVRKGIQHQLKKTAQEEREQAKQSARQLFGDLRTRTRKELEELFDRVRNGLYGEELKQAALARCRNHVGSEVSEAELRSWLDDISAASGE
ncbi:MAG: hypothetical protein PCFJNLEI_01110 [Verrucomicrobiae bacterium]|nr:hypothetical protein [Verrucomicrobiae bacterium]